MVLSVPHFLGHKLPAKGTLQNDLEGTAAREGGEGG